MLPSVFNTTVNGVPAYATGDLLTPHPTKPNFWKIFGRLDDQIMHSTGEKVIGSLLSGTSSYLHSIFETNPVPLGELNGNFDSSTDAYNAILENILNQDPHIQSAVMFGRGKFNAGVLIDPAPAFKFDPCNTTALVEFRRKIW